MIGEAVLCQQVGLTELTRAQFAYLAEVSANCPEVSIHILPFTAGKHAGSGTGFSVLQFSQLQSLGLVHIDGPAGGNYIETPAAVAAYTKTFRRMQEFSLTRQETTATLTKMSQTSS